MTESFFKITTDLASQIKLIVADVDGTLLSSGDSVNPAVAEIIRSLEHCGIMVGLASGRPISRLEPLATALEISGPLMAENGSVAKLKKGNTLFDLGYSRQPALKAFQKLKSEFTGAIREAEDNAVRMIDVGFYCKEIPLEELEKHLESVQLLDSGYMLHLLQEDVSKGKTLKRLLGLIGDGTLHPREVMVFGDSATDVSLFAEFENSVLIMNPRLTQKQTESVRNIAKYQSNLSFGDGFVEVVSYIINKRLPKCH